MTFPVVARSQESSARADEGGAVAIVADIASLPALDGAVVATPATTHAAVVEELLALGVPVFCEKPLTNDPIAAERLAALAPDRLFVMDKWRYHPGVLELAAIVRERRLGPVSGYARCRSGAIPARTPTPSGFSHRTISRSGSRSSARSGSRKRRSPNGVTERRCR